MVIIWREIFIILSAIFGSDLPNCQLFDIIYMRFFVVMIGHDSWDDVINVYTYDVIMLGILWVKVSTELQNNYYNIQRNIHYSVRSVWDSPT